MDWKKHMRRIIARLGEDATVTPAAGGGTFTVRGIYSAPYAVMLDGAALPGIASDKPRFGVMTADLGAAAVGDQLTRAGTDYLIAAAEPDEPSGLTVLQLSSDD
jgi:hypothetical protein